MYPYNFTYLKKNEIGPSSVDDGFEALYFPTTGQDGLICEHSHPIDINEGFKTPPTPFPVELVPGQEEDKLLHSDHVLPPMMSDLYGTHFYVS